MKEEIQYKPTSPLDWNQWLAENHDTEDHCWLVIAKKSSKLPSVSIVQAIEEALCYGWIDSRKRGLSETHYLLYFTPRKNKNHWSDANKILVDKLIKQGRMKKAGLNKINT